jgi:hypothetical protein
MLHLSLMLCLRGCGLQNVRAAHEFCRAQCISCKKSLEIHASTKNGQMQFLKNYIQEHLLLTKFLHTWYTVTCFTFSRLQHMNSLQQNNLLIIYNATAMISARSSRQGSYTQCQLRFSYLWLLGV